MSFESIENKLNQAADLMETPGESRRALFTLGAVAAGLFGASAESMGQRIAPPPWTRRTFSARLINRITYGVTEDDARVAEKLGFEGFLEYHLNPAKIDDSKLEADLLAMYPRLGMAPWELFGFADDWLSSIHLIDAQVRRAAFSKKQLYQKMVEFWHDHFNVTWHKVPGWMLLDFDRVIRKHAFGKFPDLLKAVSQHPAMLFFLDNTENIGATGNVNFARELLELHSISVNGGYTQRDVRDVARCFTGWSYMWNPGKPDHGTFTFYDWAHDWGEKTVLGQTIPAGGGKSDGDKVLDILSNHPMTAWFISYKMCRFFLDYQPSPAVVDRVARVYRNTGGDIRAMLRAMLTRTNLDAAQPKYKRPYHMMVGAIRQTNARLDGIQWSLLYEHMGQAGQQPFTWSFPDGFPDNLSFWAGLILPRWNFALMFPQSYVWGANVDVMSLMGTARTPDTLAVRICDLLYGRGLMPADHPAIRSFLAARPVDEYRIKAAMALGMASPTYQWY